MLALQLRPRASLVARVGIACTRSQCFLPTRSFQPENMVLYREDERDGLCSLVVMGPPSENSSKYRTLPLSNYSVSACTPSINSLPPRKILQRLRPTSKHSEVAHTTCIHMHTCRASAIIFAPLHRAIRLIARLQQPSRQRRR